ncbi:MAG: hypothetical protein R3C26_08110 [Calditrichia bacterium]
MILKIASIVRRRINLKSVVELSVAKCSAAGGGSGVIGLKFNLNAHQSVRK